MEGLKMSKALWIPWADRASQPFYKTRPGGIVEPNKFLLHTTEGTGWPAYGGGASAPNATILPDFDTRTVKVRQHFPANMSAKALRDNPNDGFRTNRDGVFQLECVGTSGWASRENPRAPYRLSDQWVSKNWPEWYLKEIARIWTWLHDEWGVPYSLPPQGFGSWARGTERFSDREFHNYKGLVGHQMVPDNDHTDPGLVDANRLLALARGGYGTVGGSVGPSKVAPISLAATMRNRGKPNGNVKIVQGLLAAQKGKDGKPFYGGVPNAIYDDRMVKAVAAYQRALGFTGSDADGLFGWTSFSKLAQWGGWKPVR